MTPADSLQTGFVWGAGTFIVGALVFVMSAVAISGKEPMPQPATGTPPKLGRRGIASWYGEQYRGKTMANGQPFNPDRLTCASNDYPLGAWLEVQLDQPGFPPRSVTVQVTDRGPAQQLCRMLDLSRAAFARLQCTAAGVIPVVATEIQPEH